MSVDIIFQIINAALFSDESFEIMDRQLIRKVNNKLDAISAFANLKTLLDANKVNQPFLYLQAFDNYIKHIKTILVPVKTSFMIGSNDEFLIKDFIYKGIHYPLVNDLDKVKEVNMNFIEFLKFIHVALMNTISIFIILQMIILG